ncbi:hypothetical protein PAI11_42940 [Patulibacter medicamentivorans]|uniref:Glycosyl transferase family 28 C-terminal domain-containing protein n=1 Tax=Patulibacter medicamentivorans TaxID=1097667 RepID=H0EBR1_9ACTN|nr:hypothetical protein [Patulibacter medicamentivorans]EHN08886.1 hypothetical protein PAI11_42940 [Patulibacter medicamentivorans]
MTGGRILYYAIGGGLGHLVRARRVVRTLGLEDRVALLTASRFARDERVTGGLPVVRVAPGLEREPWRIRDLIACQQPSELVVDAFPLGILGELDGIADVPIRHVARRLRWERYRERIGSGRIHFATTHLLEPLEPEHERFLRERSDVVEELVPEREQHRQRRAAPGPHWLVVHSGPDEETLELVATAREHQRTEGVEVPLVLVAPRRPPGLPAGVVWRDVHPAASLFAAADRLVTAAGWNVVDEASPFRERHHVVPFRRSLDDQAARATRVRRERAGLQPS